MSSAEVPFERRFPGKWMEFYSAEELSIQERLVWRTINEYQWSNEDAWPSYRTLGRVCGIGGRQVQRIVKSLERKGLLWITHNKKRGHSNRYRCLIPENMGDRRQEYYDMINGVVPELSGGHPEDVTRTRGVTLVTPVTDMDDVPSTMSATYRYDVDVAPGVTPIAAERTKEGVRKGSGNGSGESSLRSPTRTQDPNPKTIPNPIPETWLQMFFRAYDTSWPMFKPIIEEKGWTEKEANVFAEETPRPEPWQKEVPNPEYVEHEPAPVREPRYSADIDDPEV